MFLPQDNSIITPPRLDSFGHADGLRHFMDFFKLRQGPPSLQSLAKILSCFANLPYENLSKIINFHDSPDWQTPKIRLPEEVMSGHSDFRLGGTCFSLTFFLQSILTLQDFTCYPVMADMRAGRNIHCCLVVLLDGVKFLVDPGYLLTRPMALDLNHPRQYRTEFAGVELRFEQAAGAYDLFTFNRFESKWRYRFHDVPVSPDEFLRHWLASFSRNSMNGLCLTKVLKDGVLFVNRDFMRETTFSGKRNFNIKRNFHQAIQEQFGIAPEVVERAKAALLKNRERRLKIGTSIRAE